MSERPAYFDRFWAKVDKSGDCWLWTGTAPAGYGQIGIDGRLKGAHRVAWEMERGPIEDGFVIDHLCCTPRCVNPDHLKVVTVAENNLRGMSPAAKNARKTACHRGHPFQGDNVIDDRGNRQCRTCRNERQRAYKRRRKERERDLTS